MLAASTARRKLVATDAVFSMDGDIARSLHCWRYASATMPGSCSTTRIGFGVLGADGRGVLGHFNLASKRIIYMATLGKAAGVFGAFVAGEPDLIEMLIQRARPYIYTTATPPMLAHALLASLDIIAAENWRRDHLAQLIAALRQGVTGLRWT
jgi:8-amino-7-oxononanoate synthase